ncbi:MAG: hypothetical protein M0R77_02175 [Gammaproteobacteria bacterium]|nr:hypothetical protein [Gammaproteobacteria bacterium]
MALPDQTLELTNIVQMPRLDELLGDELLPAANNATEKLPVSITSESVGDYVLGKYVFNLTTFPTANLNGNTTLMLADQGQTYLTSINDLSSAITPSITITGTGLAYVTDNGPADKTIDVPKATLEECDAAVRDDVAVTPAGLANYKARLDILEAQMAALLYKPMAITSFSASPNLVEIGSSVGSVTLNWSLNKTAATLAMTNYTGTPLTPSDTTATVNGPFSSDRSWTLTVSDGTANAGNTATSTASLQFRNKRYWGVSPNTTLTDSEIIALSSEFSTSKVKDVTYNATGGRYVYYAYPASFGTLNAVTVGGLAFSDFTTTVINFTNASGYASQYNLIRINNIQTGANIQVHWA